MSILSTNDQCKSFWELVYGIVKKYGNTVLIRFLLGHPVLYNFIVCACFVMSTRVHGVWLTVIKLFWCQYPKQPLAEKVILVSISRDSWKLLTVIFKSLFYNGKYQICITFSRILSHRHRSNIFLQFMLIPYLWITHGSTKCGYGRANQTRSLQRERDNAKYVCQKRNLSWRKGKQATVVRVQRNLRQINHMWFSISW